MRRFRDSKTIRRDDNATLSKIVKCLKALSSRKRLSNYAHAFVLTSKFTRIYLKNVFPEKHSASTKLR